ncbi:MAG: hypothetical protein F9K31_01915 [Dokdonella sp.]|nr:MAG: hypothetical protein F9K31_01915 [Dokdonella sp.]
MVIRVVRFPGLRRAAWALAALWLSAPAEAGNDRIFANGFEPCCHIGGTVSGLSGSGLVLRLAAGAITQDTSISGNGQYAFASDLAPGESYAVTITTQPTGQSCTVANAVGIAGDANSSRVDVQCGTGLPLNWDHGNWDADWQ